MGISAAFENPRAGVVDNSLLPELGIGSETDSALSTPISRDRILVVAKLSKLKWDQQHTGLSQTELSAYYERQGESSSAIVTSHLRQAQVVKDLTRELSPSQFVSITKLSADRVKNCDLVIALGGDDHFKHVSHWIDDDTPVLGVNSDVDSSEGNILSCSAAALPQVLHDLECGAYRLEPWTRLRLKVDGKDIGPAIGEVVLAKRDFRLMSRHILEVEGERVVQKSSGLLISTGTGSSGWFTSAGLYLAPNGREFPRTALHAHFELREPHVRFVEHDGERTIQLPPHVEGELLQGAILKITSLNNSDGIATRDSIDTIPFGRGSIAEVRIDHKPLWVVTPRRTQGANHE